MKPVEVENNELGKYSVAPYNFISFPKCSVVRYNSIEELPSHDSLKKTINNENAKDLLTGFIEYELVAKTPIIVSKGIEEDKISHCNNANFFKNSNRKDAIPGSSIRGMVKTNSQILSYSSVVDDISNDRFLYRDIASGNSLNKVYINEIEDVKTGCICYENKKYYIYPSKDIGGNTYFKIDELYLRTIANDELKINYMYNYKIVKKENGKKEVKRNKKDFLNENFLPYQIGISFKLDKDSKIIEIGKPQFYEHNGYLICTNYIRGKNSHFIIPKENDKASKICISEDSIEVYKKDLIRTKKVDKNGIVKGSKNKFYTLPSKEGEKKPVFFTKKDINTNGDIKEFIHFGFGPYFRIFYRNSIHDAISEEYKEHKGISYSDSIFGFSEGDEYSYKSRVSSEDALIVENKGVESEDKESIMEIILSEPKPTSFNLYLKQELNNDKKSLNIYDSQANESENFELRGIKQYWLRDHIIKPTIDKKNQNVMIKIHPLKKGTKFGGKIHFTNLHYDELGLILWALKLEDDSYQNIGLAKPYGFGRVKVENVKLKLEDIDEKYASFTFDY